MKRTLSISALFLGVFFLANAIFAQTTPQKAQIKTNNQTQIRTNWVDADGDGICDNFGTAKQGSGKMKRMNGQSKGQGLGNGAGNGKHYGDGSGIRPQDGTGFGAGNGSGTCNGTGRKGKGGRRGGK